jgi:hypothetical protein
MAFDLDFAAPTEHETRVAEKCDVKIEKLENALAWLHDHTPASGDGPDQTSWRVDAELAQSELEFWRAKRLRATGSTGHHEGRDGYWLVPREPSVRALRRATGLTDLADISSSPRNLDSTLSEIGLAVRIAIETDGIPIMQPDGLPKAADSVDLDARIMERKEILIDLDNTRTDFVQLAARYLELREGLSGRKCEAEETAYLDGRERELDKFFAVAALEGPLAPSITAWREFLAKSKT